MSGDKRCILHLASADKARLREPLKEFTEKTWFNVKQAECVRRCSQKNSKFFEIDIPTTNDTNDCYHSSCYKDYTAIPKDEKHAVIVSEQCCEHTLRSNVIHPGTSNTGVFESVCLFCEKERKWAKGKYETLGKLDLTKSANKIFEAAKNQNDYNLLAKISGQDLVAKEVKFHHSCRKLYCKKGETSHFEQKPKDGREKKTSAYENLRIYVKENLVDNNGSEKLKFLYDRYLLAKKDTDEQYSSQYLCEKLLKQYPTDLKTCKASNKEGVILYNSNLSEETAINRANFDCSLVKETAYYLRSQIRMHSAGVKELPSPLTEDILKTGQTATPPDLLDFFRVLYGESRDPEKLGRLVRSTSDDVVFNVTLGRVKPGKHISVGIGIKSMTGSRKVVEVLNRFGHSISYHTAEELETQIATEIADRQNTTPDGIIQKEGLCTAVAWDNYDENTETLSGSGTLHDTVGICYQNIIQDEEQTDIQSILDEENDQETTLEKASNISSSAKKKRAYKKFEDEITPYRKKPKMSVFSFPKRDMIRPECLNRIEWLDKFWTMNVAFGENTPMWAGWNSLIEEDKLPRQRIFYMNNITLPPTRLDVVVETMRRSQKVAEECKEKYMAVTYDLAVAKPAMQIQAAESPLYDNLFICFGAFHILLAYFGALGYFIDGSGGPQILIDSEVLAEGSLNGFIKGKHYNRCVRLHEILACAFQSLHIKRFLKEEGEIPAEIKEGIASLNKKPSPDSIIDIESLPQYTDLMTRYDGFTQKTMNGEHGSTAKYWLIYIVMVSLYLKFSRACRTNNLRLFITTLKDMVPVFFAMNRPNYARWMVRYYFNLLNADKTHPGIEKYLREGAMSVRRTDKTFSRIPVDMALEQTVNADAASRKTGIVAFTNSDGSRQRWMMTRAMRSSIVGNMFEMTGLRNNDDVARTLRKSRIERDNADVKKIVEKIKTTLNPFQMNPENKLYCLTTGKQVSSETSQDLLNCLEVGGNWEREFTNGCFNDPTRFEKPIPRRKVRNFTADAVKTKVTSKDKQVIELRGTRDLFGRLLYISTINSVDLQKVFSYPLVPVPLSIGQIDGSVHKTDKSKLMSKLEKVCVGPLPLRSDVVFVDATFMLHTLCNIPRTMGDVSQMILAILCKKANVVHFVCDTYSSPSIKDIERGRRGEDDAVYTITGRDQKAPSTSKWQEALKCSNFKTALFQFLASDWKNSIHAPIVKNHEVYIGFDSKCYCFTERNGTLIHEEKTQYSCHHEEADTRLIYHLRICIQEMGDAKVTYCIRSNDTDVFILLLYHVGVLGISNVWMDAGLDKANTRRYINIASISETLGPRVIKALPGIHAFTGCDYTGAFVRKGKKKAFDVMLKKKEFIEAFGEFGEAIDLSNPVKKIIETFVCHLYGKSRLEDVNKARLMIFEDKYKFAKSTDVDKSTKGPLENIKGFNPSSMPPCQAVLEEKIARTNYVTAVWKRSDRKLPVEELPSGNGWKLNGRQYEVSWFKGNQLPQSVVELLVTNSLDQEDEEEEVPGECSDSDSEIEGNNDDDEANEEQ